MNALKLARQDRIAHADAKCDHHKCQKTWGTQMRQKGQILHLCNKHGAELISARGNGKDQKAANAFVDELTDKDAQEEQLAYTPEELGI